jgi:thioredoxin
MQQQPRDFSLHGAVDLGARQAAQRRQAARAPGDGDTSAEQPGNVIEVTDDTFSADVIERSRSVPVILDLWAEWCGPCKQLGPVLESLADEADGAWVLAKVDVDANPQLSAALQVQSIPMVVAVVAGQIAEVFLGAMPEAQVREWLGVVMQIAEQLGLPGYQAGDADDGDDGSGPAVSAATAGGPPAGDTRPGQTRPGQARPGEARPGQAPPGPARPGPGQGSPGRPGPAQPGPGQLGPAQRRPGQPGPGQPGPAQRRPAQPGPGQPGPAQPGPAQRRPAQPGPGQPGPGARNGSDQGAFMADAAFGEAQQAMERGDLDGAAAAFERVLAATPGHPVAAMGLAQVDLIRRVNTYDQAAVRRAADASPDDVESQARAADIELATGRVDAGFARLLEIVRRTSGEERDQARVRLLGLFDVFPPKDPRVTKARATLSSLLF